MLMKNPYALVVAFESVGDTNNFDVNDLEKRYNEFEKVITQENVQEILKKYDSKIDSEQTTALKEAAQRLDVLSNEFAAERLEIFERTAAKRAKIVEAIIPLAKWMFYKQNDVLSDLHALSAGLQKETPYLPQLPELPDNLDDLKDKFAQKMDIYDKKINDPKIKGLSNLSKEALQLQEQQNMISFAAIQMRTSKSTTPSRAE